MAGSDMKSADVHPNKMGDSLRNSTGTLWGIVLVFT